LKILTRGRPSAALFRDAATSAGVLDWGGSVWGLLRLKSREDEDEDEDEDEED
jgi:hypothetical protein